MFFLYFIVLFTFYACKNDTNISNRHKPKTNTAIYKSLGKSKDQYIHIQTACKLSRLYLSSKQSLRVLQLRKRRKSEKTYMKKRKASYLIWIRLTFDKLCMLKTPCMQNRLLNGYKRYWSVRISPYLISPKQTILSVLHPCLLPFKNKNTIFFTTLQTCLSVL